MIMQILGTLILALPLATITTKALYFLFGAQISQIPGYQLGFPLIALAICLPFAWPAWSKVWNLVCGGFYGFGDMVKPVIIDTSALINGKICLLIEDGIIDNRILIPRCVLDQLRSMAGSSDIEKRTCARKALDRVSMIRSTARHFETPKLRLVDEDTMDFVITAYAKKHETKIITTSKTMEKAAQIEGVPVINLQRQEYKTQSPEPKIGDKIQITIARNGENPGQGIGFQEEHMIIVENGAEDINNTIQVEIIKRVTTQGGILFFARKVKL